MRPWILAPLAIALTLTACGGGSRFSMVITSNPSDALVYVNDYPRGVTPVEVPYEFIGTYRIQLHHADYQDVDTLQFVGKPWFDWIPFMSFFIDTLPLPVRHEVRLHYDMTPLPVEEF
jgi:hypothetical protein